MCYFEGLQVIALILLSSIFLSVNGVYVLVVTSSLAKGFRPTMLPLLGAKWTENPWLAKMFRTRFSGFSVSEEYTSFAGQGLIPKLDKKT